MSQEWKLVPTNPAMFLDMGWAYLDAAREAEPNKSWSFSHAGYKAMLAAAPVLSHDGEVDNSPEGVKREVFEIASRERDTVNAEIAELRGTQSFRNSLFTRVEAERDALLQRLNVADQRIDDLQHERSQILEVNPHSLRAVLTALVGAPHEIREIQACRGLPDNAIDQLLREYNAWVETPAPTNSPQ